MKSRIFVGLVFITFLLPSCASYRSSCEELSSVGASRLRSMVKDAKRAPVERHVLMLETGSVLADSCRTHLISGKEFRDLDDTVNNYCRAQASIGDQYCILYSLDGEKMQKTVAEFE